MTALNWNFERDGKRNRHLRRTGYEKLASLNPDLVFRQEMWGADEDGKQVMYELENLLGMRGWLGERSCTALFANPEKFTPVREWPPGPVWVLPPTALSLRYLPAGPHSSPMVAVSYHLNYASSHQRLTVAEWLTTFADKKWSLPDGRATAQAALFGGDNNSFPAQPLTEGDPALPQLKAIQDRPHRLHRSTPGPDGARDVVDTRPDTALRAAGLYDLGRWQAANGQHSAVARTVNAYDGYGPDSRIDRVYATEQLLPAVLSIDVVEVPVSESDHHIVRVQLDGGVLADILNAPLPGTT
ncbi:endonuclease/exonuclease/phosphatase family protein [Streptomyces sp. enrichment culture]|uniref:endonuclease/exonuclease/phosphatase family protein n=1 Tax=Streptomyces sp. enrichment culture TaxID=1795815 RepID=UPI003F55C3BC